MTTTDESGSIATRRPNDQSAARLPSHVAGSDLPKAAASEQSAWTLWARPLRLHLSIIIVVLLVSISVPLMWRTYEQGTQSAVETARREMGMLSQHTIDRYRSIFTDGLAAVSLTSVTEEFLAPPPAGVNAKTEFLLKALTGSPYVDGIYVGYPTGEFIHAVNVGANPAWAKALAAPDGAAFAMRTIEIDGTNGEVSIWRFIGIDGQRIGERSTQDVNYDPRDRPWYEAASEADAPIMVGPYAMATTKSVGLTLATRMSKNPQIVAGADLPLETLSHLLANEAVSPNARGYVFDDQGHLIVHSDKTLMGLLFEDPAIKGKDGGSAKTSDDPVLDAVRPLLQASDAPGDRTQSFYVGGEPFLAHISTVSFSDLVQGNVIVLAAPLSDLTAASDALLKENLLIAGMFLVAGILAALIVAHLVSKSLARLTSDARQIGDLDLDRQQSVWSHIAEINALAGALGTARDAIRMFALYVPRDLVRRIVAAGQSTDVTAVRQKVTVLFTDIRDFTTISENHSPEEVVSLLSGYFQLMNDIVERHNGVIVQYLGDSIHAMWNAPTADPEHVDDGCRCALALKAGVDELNRSNCAQGVPQLVTRYGLHTGTAVVGSVGALTRRQYTAMGDTVNVASRLEGLNKEFGTTIIASKAVKERAGPSFVFRSLGPARAKGRAEQIEVFELVGTS